MGQEIEYDAKIHWKSKDGNFEGCTSGKVTAPNKEKAKEQCKTVFDGELSRWLKEQEGLEEIVFVKAEINDL